MAARPTRVGKFEVGLLGRFELHRGDEPLTASPASRRLLAYLAVQFVPVERSTVAAVLWPDFTDRRATANLRSTLCRLPRRGRDRIVDASARAVQLQPEVAVDVHRVHDAIGTGTNDLDPNLLSLDVLPDWSDHWLVPVREWFRQTRLRALETLCAYYRRSGRYQAAVEAGMVAVAGEPLRESAHRHLTQVHLAEGNPAEALRQYEMYRRLLASELGLPPSSQFRSLVAPLLGRPLDDPAR